MSVAGIVLGGVRASRTVARGARGVATQASRGGKALRNGLKLGGTGGLAYGAKKAFDFVSNAISKLMSGNNNSGRRFSSTRGKNKTKNSQAGKPGSVSQKITLKKHDYPNSYRVQLNQLSNNINYVQKQDKISKRKTDNKYQSILCKKILKKLTLHTEVQNDLIVNEINNVLSANSDINEKTKKTFIGNIVDLITPKSKASLSDTFANANTLKELKSITKTQVKIYSALKDLSDINLKGLKEKKKEHVYTPIAKSKSKGGASYVSGQNGNLLGGMLSALLGGALFAMFNPFGDDKGDGKENKKNDPIQQIIANGADVLRFSAAKASRTRLQRASTDFKGAKTDTAKARKTTQHIRDLKTDTQAKKAQLKNTTDPAVKKQLEDAIKKNQKFIAKAKEILGNRCGMIARKVFNCIKGLGVGVLLMGVQVLILDYEKDHLDEILGRPATDEDRMNLTSITVLENIPVVGFWVALLDLAPCLLNLGGVLITDLIVPFFRWVVREYRLNKYSNPILKAMFDKFGKNFEYLMDIAIINLDFAITILDEAGKFLSCIDPNFLLNSLNKAQRFLVNTAESLNANKSSIIKQLNSRGLTKTRGIFMDGIGDVSISDENLMIIEKEYSSSDIEQMLSYKGFDTQTLLKLENIKNNKEREQRRKIEEVHNEQDLKKKAQLIMQQEDNVTREQHKALTSTFLSNLENVEYDKSIDWYTKQFFEVWKKYIEDTKKSHQDELFLICPPLVTQSQGVSKFGQPGEFFIFLYGTVAKVKDTNKDAFFCRNLQTVGVMLSTGSVKITEDPANDDQEQFDYFNIPVEERKSKWKERQNEIYKSLLNPQSASVSKNVNNAGGMRMPEASGSYSGYGASAKARKVPVSQVTREIWTYLRNSLGLTPEQSAGVMGNIMRECSMNPSAFNGQGGGQGAYGLCQWRGDRQTKLKQLAQRKGKDISDVQVQLEHLKNELTGNYSRVYAALKSAKTVEEATDIWTRRFEVCGNYNTEVPERIGFARGFLKQFNETQETQNEQNPAEASKDTSASSSASFGLSSENLKMGFSEKMDSESLKYGSSSPEPVSTSTESSTAPAPAPVNEQISSENLKMGKTDSNKKDDKKASVSINKLADSAISCAIATQKENNGKKSGHCASAVRKSLQKAGFKVPTKSKGSYPDAFEYHTGRYLEKMGFNVVHTGLEGFTPKKGDICVINKFGNHKYGHICVFNGSQWVSDHVQKQANPYKNGKEKPTEGVWYYRYGGNPDESVNAEPDTNSSQSMTESSGDNYSSGNASAKTNTSDANKRAESFSKDMNASTQKTEEKEGDKKPAEQNANQNQNNTMDMLHANPVTKHIISNAKNAESANALFSFKITDWELIDKHIAKYYES